MYRVLVADDDRMIRDLLARLCRDMGWEADLAADGSEALALMGNGEHQIYVIDVRMPPPAGVELAREILLREETPAILILTGHAELQDAVAAMREGVCDFVQKDELDFERIRGLMLKAARFHENRRNAVEAQREREAAFHDYESANRRFQSILELSHEIICIFDARSLRIADCNATACRRLGYSRGQLLKLSFGDIDPGFTEAVADESERMEARESERMEARGAAGAGRSPGPASMEREYRTRDGEAIPVEVSFARVCPGRGEYIAAVARDIAKRKRAERALRDSEERFRGIGESAMDAIVLAGPDGRVRFWNRAAVAMFGYSADEAVGLRVFDIMVPESGRETAALGFRAFARSGRLAFHERVREIRAMRKNGTVFDAEMSMAAVQLGGEWNAIAIVRDISERKRAEEQLDRALRRIEKQSSTFGAMIESLGEGLMYADEDGTIREANRGMAQLSRRPVDFLIGHNLADTIRETAGCAVESFIERFQNGGLTDSIHIQGGMHGRVVRVSLRPVFGNRAYAGVIATVTDVTDLLAFGEETRLQYKKLREDLEDRGRELKTPLDGIRKMAARLLETRLDTEQRLCIETIAECGDLMARLLEGDEWSRNGGDAGGDGEDGTERTERTERTDARDTERTKRTKRTDARDTDDTVGNK